MKRHMLIIDPQNDFCDKVNGRLNVQGADEDMYRLAELIRRLIKTTGINDIHVTLDNHRLMHIAHPIFWVNDKNEHPKPYTCITIDDIEKGVWKASVVGYGQVGEDYVKELNRRGRFPLVIWPPHCLVNTWGASVYPTLESALNTWESHYNLVNYIPKGQDITTEMYGAFEAEVPIENTDIGVIRAISKFYSADEIIIAGEALSHCVAETVRQLAKYISPSKFVLLSDCTSNVPTFEKLGEDFVKELMAKGMKVCKSWEIE